MKKVWSKKERRNCFSPKGNLKEKSLGFPLRDRTSVLLPDRAQGGGRASEGSFAWGTGKPDPRPGQGLLKTLVLHLGQDHQSQQTRKHDTD